MPLIETVTEIDPTIVVYVHKSIARLGSKLHEPPNKPTVTEGGLPRPGFT